MGGGAIRLEGRVSIDWMPVGWLSFNLKILVTNLEAGESRKVKSTLGSRSGLTDSRSGLANSLIVLIVFTIHRCPFKKSNLFQI